MTDLIYPATTAPLLRGSDRSLASEMLPVVDEHGNVIAQASRAFCHSRFAKRQTAACPVPVRTEAESCAPGGISRTAQPVADVPCAPGVISRTEESPVRTEAESCAPGVISRTAQPGASVPCAPGVISRTEESPVRTATESCAPDGISRTAQPGADVPCAPGGNSRTEESPVRTATEACAPGGDVRTGLNAKPLHPVVHLHIISRDGRIYLQQRSATKDLLPLRWDTAVGGHVAYGEYILEALYREASEELGFTDFNPVFITSYVFESEAERELVNVFATVGDFTLKPDGEEVIAGRYWSPEEIEAACGKEILTPNFESEYHKIKKSLQALL